MRTEKGKNTEITTDCRRFGRGNQPESLTITETIFKELDNPRSKVFNMAKLREETKEQS